MDEGTRVAVLAAAEAEDGSAAGVERLWDRMSLSAAPVRAPDRRPAEIPAALQPVLGLFETAALGSLTGGPSVPSAGAIYPYEHYVVLGSAAYLLDPVWRTCRLVRSGAAVTRAVERSGLGSPGPADALVLTVVRPWLSMRKYGDRGYMYAQLDAAHLVTHLLGLAGEGARLHTQLPTGPLADLLDLSRHCRLLHSVLRPGRTASSPGGPAWTGVDDRGASPVRDSTRWLEAECWRSLSVGRAAQPARGETAVRRRPLLAGLGGPPGLMVPARDVAPEIRRPGPDEDRAEALPGGRSLARLAARRRSAKDFAPSVLPAAALRRALAALRTPLATDLSAASELGVTVVVRAVAGLAPGSHLLWGSGPAAVRPVPPPDDLELVRAFMGQEHLRHGSAVVVVHQARPALLRDGPPGMEEALLRAGALVHLLYLGAVDAGLAVTAVGGFDAGRWRALAGLPDRHEVLYLAVLGRPGAASVKADRLQLAYSDDGR